MEGRQRAEKEFKASLRDLDPERQDELCRPQLRRTDAAHSQPVMQLAQNRAERELEALEYPESQAAPPQGFLHPRRY